MKILLIIALLALTGCGPSIPTVTKSEVLMLPDGKRATRYTVEEINRAKQYIYVIDGQASATVNRLEGGKYQTQRAEAFFYPPPNP